MLGFAVSPSGIDPLRAAALGVLQGIAEFLPISSSGHLILGQHLLGLDGGAQAHTFNIVVHGGTLVAVIWVYRHVLRQLLSDALGEGAPREAARRMILAIVVATLPLALVLLDPVAQLVTRAEADPRVVGAAFWLTAAVLGFTHRRLDSNAEEPAGAVESPESPESGGLEKDPSPFLQGPTLWMALVIGLAQLVAVLPGVSRSGATIAAALALGTSRTRAARFSFLISIPAILGACAKEALDLLKSPTPIQPVALGVGFVTSAVVGLLALRALLAILERFGLLPFVPYLIIAGGLAMFWV